MNMTVTKALTEIKKLDKQIAKLTQKSAFIGSATNGRVPGFRSLEEVSAHIKSGYDKIRALMTRRATIKAKVTASNAATSVTIAGKTITVAEAIERKESIEQEETMLGMMKQQYSAVMNKQLRHDNQNQSEIDRKVEQVLGNMKKIDANDTTYQAIKEQVEAGNKFELVDPIGISKVIDELEDSIDDFKANVDVELSVSNATTSIELED